MEYNEEEIRKFMSLGYPKDCQNAYILKWWTPQHDELMSKRIEKLRWHWYDPFLDAMALEDELVSITPPDVIDAWKAENPYCSGPAWRTILWSFAVSRATQIGLIRAIQAPYKKICPLCNEVFFEAKVSASFVVWLGIDQIDYCDACLSAAVDVHSGLDALSSEQVLTSLQELATLLQIVPSEGYFTRGRKRLAEVCAYPPERRTILLRALKNKPTTERVKFLFGSWFQALVEAGILQNGTRRNRGTQCIARDGHVCYSIGEKTIDDLLSNLNIQHEREPRYPEGNFRADFVSNGVLIEYFGLGGDGTYDVKTKLKQDICRKHQIRLISIYPQDLMNSTNLAAKLIAGIAESSE
ncbi:MAG: hypothetical protein WAU45_09245 [Blastocatellia bacterium]